MRRIKHGHLGKLIYHKEKFEKLPPTTEERMEEIRKKLQPWSFDENKIRFVGGIGFNGGTPAPDCDFNASLVYSVELNLTGTTQYYDVILSATTDLTSPTFVWTLNNFREVDGTERTSYTGQTLVEGYFTTTDSDNVSVVATGDEGSASTTDFTITEQSPTIWVGSNATSTLLTSNDAITWSTETSSQSSNTSGAYGNRIAVMAKGTSGTSNRLSTNSGDTTTWYTPSYSTSNRMEGMVYAEYLNAFFTGAYSSGQPAYSYDGTTWTNTSGTLTSDNYGVGVDNDNEVILYVADNGYLYETYSGASFTTNHNFSGTTAHRSIIRNSYLGYTYVFEATAGGPIYYSEDNSTWSASTNPMTGQMWNDASAVRPSDGRMLIVSYGDNTGAITNDGINWSATTLPNIDSNYYLTCDYVGGDVDLFVAVSRSGKVVTSPDGITWTQRTQTNNVDAFVSYHGYKRG